MRSLLLAIGLILVAAAAKAESPVAVAFDKTLDAIIVISPAAKTEIYDTGGKDPLISYGVKGELVCLVKRITPEEPDDSRRVEATLYDTRTMSKVSTKVEAEYMGVLGSLFSNVAIDSENAKVYFVVVCDQSHVAKNGGSVGTYVVAWDYRGNTLEYYRTPRVETMHDAVTPHIYSVDGRVFLGDDDSLYSCRMGEGELALEPVYEAGQVDPRQAVGPKHLTQPPRFSLDRTSPVAFHYLDGRGLYWTDNQYTIVKIADASLTELPEPVSCLRYSDRFITDLAVTTINGENYFIYGESLESGYKIDSVVILDPGTGDELKRIELPFAGYSLSPVNYSNDGSFVTQDLDTANASFYNAGNGIFAALGPLGVHARTKMLVER